MLVGQDIEQTMVSLEELLNKETFDRGRKEGVEAVVKGQRTALLRLLVRRFGALPESVTQRVASASSEELTRWTERILDATSFDDMFAAP